MQNAQQVLGLLVVHGLYVADQRKSLLSELKVIRWPWNGPDLVRGRFLGVGESRLRTQLVGVADANRWGGTRQIGQGFDRCRWDADGRGRLLTRHRARLLRWRAVRSNS